MEHRHHDHGSAAPTTGTAQIHRESPRLAGRRSLDSTALSATVHCLTGCAIGEVLGMVTGTALRLGKWPTVALSVVLAFCFGYSLTMLPLLRVGLGLKTALALAFASDTASIGLMELVDNVIMLYIPGAMEAALSAPLFWGSLAASLLIAGVVAFPLNGGSSVEGWATRFSIAITTELDPLAI